MRELVTCPCGGICILDDGAVIGGASIHCNKCGLSLWRARESLEDGILEAWQALPRGHVPDEMVFEAMEIGDRVCDHGPYSHTKYSSAMLRKTSKILDDHIPEERRKAIRDKYDPN